MQKYVKLIIKGFILGATFMIPGVSGAIIAIMLGMFDEMIIAASNLRKDFKKNILYLAPIGLGAIIGIFSTASLVSLLVENFEVYMMYFLLGSIIGSIPIMLKKSEVKNIEFKYILYVIVGILCILALNLLPEASYEAERLNLIFIIVGGLFIALALILPGLSTFAVLAALGIFEITMQAMNDFNISFLLPLGISTVIWIGLTIKILEKSITNHPSITYLVITGFLIGSMVEVYPTNILEGFSGIGAVLLILMGASLVTVFSKLSDKKEKNIETVEHKKHN